MKLLALIGAGAMVAGTMVAAVPADAQHHYRGHGYHRGWNHYPRHGYGYRHRGWHPYRAHYRHGYRHGYRHRW